jgi:hypothetical protein
MNDDLILVFFAGITVGLLLSLTLLGSVGNNLLL